ncbi:MAG: ArsR/SmtB family transcription factor [Rhodospirillaceae bacterium]
MDTLAAAEGFAALGNTTRLDLFRFLVRCGSDGATVGTIKSHLDIPASTLAHHLSILCRAGLVSQERQGREVISRPAFDHVEALSAFLLEDCCKGPDGISETPRRAPMDDVA